MLCDDPLERGEAALAKGWIARAQDLLTAVPDSPLPAGCPGCRRASPRSTAICKQALAFAQIAYDSAARAATSGPKHWA